MRGVFISRNEVSEQPYIAVEGKSNARDNQVSTSVFGDNVYSVFLI